MGEKKHRLKRKLSSQQYAKMISETMNSKSSNKINTTLPCQRSPKYLIINSLDLWKILLIVFSCCNYHPHQHSHLNVISWVIIMFIPMLSVGNHRDHHVHLNVISWVMGLSVFPAALPALFGELWACLLRSSSPSSSKASYTIYHRDYMTSLVPMYRQG